jgi:hypothetical protein
VGTPRSGHTWLRKLLASIYSLEKFGIHKLEELDWENLPPRMALQVHRHPTESFRALLRTHGFHVVSPARHPLDLLISMLNYIQYTPDPPRWTSASGKGECTLVRAAPLSEEFLQFACGEIPDHLFTSTGPWWQTPTELLAITSQWWQTPGTICLRYEDLVNEPVATLAKICARISPDLKRSIEDVVTATTMDELRAAYGDYHFHFWQGRPGHWKALLTAQVVGRIAAAHPEMFQPLGYECAADLELTPAQADLNWYRLQFESERQHMEIERSNHTATRKALQEDRSRSGTLEQALAAAQGLAAQAQRDAARMCKRYTAMRRVCRAMLDERGAALAHAQGFEGLGPVSIGIARRLNHLSRRFPRISGAVKQFIHPERKLPVTLPITDGANARPRGPVRVRKAAS